MCSDANSFTFLQMHTEMVGCHFKLAKKIRFALSNDSEI